MVSGLFIGLIVGTQYAQKVCQNTTDKNEGQFVLTKKKINTYSKIKSQKNYHLQYANFMIVFCIFSILRIKEITI